MTQDQGGRGGVSSDVSAEEVSRFGALAPRWWETGGPMRELHRMNPVRVAWISRLVRARCGEAAALLDLGCGGGIATEALAREGFRVTGVDASEEAVGVARSHAASGGLDIEYRVGLAAALLSEDRRFPAIVALEIIEHVPDQAAFIATLAGLLAPGGLLFVSTLNRTWRSWGLAKIGAEYIARLLPVGTHDWRRFVRPDELASMGRAAGLRPLDVTGMVFGGAGWSASADVSVNYLMCLAAP